MSAPLFPAFLKLGDRPALVVGGGAMAATRTRQLLEAGAEVTVVAPSIRGDIAESGARCLERRFEPGDLDGAWFAVAAAPPEVNAAVARAAEERRIFVNAVDDPELASAYSGAVLRRGGMVAALSTEGQAPALAGLLREALELLLPTETAEWVEEAARLRQEWKAAQVPMGDRRPLLLRALNRRYGAPEEAGP